MLHWLFPASCPIPDQAAAWVEWRLRWLLRRLGRERFLKQRFFPPDCGELLAELGDPATRAHVLLPRLIKHIGLSGSDVQLHVAEPEDSGQAAGMHYQDGAKHHIVVRADVLDDAQRLVVVLGHELLHALLLGRGHLQGNESDLEATTDLALVYFGLGAPGANATLRERGWHEGTMQFMSWSQVGYLGSSLLGYALAVAAYWRGEDAPGWAKGLRADALEPFRKGLRHLRKGRQSLLVPPLTDAALAANTLAAAVASRSAKLRHAALLDLPEATAASRAEPLARLLLDSDRSVAFGATRLLASEGGVKPSDPLVAALFQRAVGTDREFAAAALEALVAIAPGHERSLRAIEALLLSHEALEVMTALRAVARVGRAASRLGPVLARLLSDEMNRGGALTEPLLGALLATTSTPENVLAAHMPSFARHRERCQLLLARMV